MNDTEINEAIASAMGFDFDPAKAHKWSSRGVWITAPSGEAMLRVSIPKFCNDLNAMHEAEKMLPDDQAAEYVTMLCLHVQPEPKLFHATARQRAEAFLRTIGKWRDE